MSRRFKASKYKNAAPKQNLHHPWVRDLVVGSYNGYGNFIKASAAFAAFNVNPTGSQLGIVALDAEGPVTGQNVAILNAHSDLVTDFDFSPFEDGLLATCSADSTVKIWSINLDNLSDLSLLTPECATNSKRRRVETCCFHPVAECLLSYASQNTLSLWDILYNKELIQVDTIHPDKIMSMSWNKAGDLLATACKDKVVRLLDPRTTEVTATAQSHKNDKDTRIVWLGDSHYVLTSGFDSSRMRQVFVRDIRKFEKPVKVQEFDSSTGILMPLYDQDTNMIFLAGRGDSSISYFEFNPDMDPDFLFEGYRHNGEQTKGACIVPKRALRVMDTEVNRVLQLTASSIIPIPYFVPRKTYATFHHDLFPNTRGTKTTGDATSWMDGHNGIVLEQSLNPSEPRAAPSFLGDGSLRVFKPSLATRRAEEKGQIKGIVEGGSGSYKKAVPEPRPRKKSLTPSNSSSSSDEVGDILVASPNPNFPRLFPVPKPRVSNNTTTTGLRTPSSFISRMAADFSHRSSKDDDSENHNVSGPPSLQDEEAPPLGKNGEEDEVFNNGDYHNGNSNGHDQHDQKSDGCASSNGNGHASSSDKEHLTTSDRRKLFERKISQEYTSNGYELSPGMKQARVNVAERLKMYQQNATNDPSQPTVEPEQEQPKEKEEEKEVPKQKKEPRMGATFPSSPLASTSSDPSTSTKTKERDFHPAPIAKPERRFTPPKTESSTPSPPRPTASEPALKSMPSKRIDTVFGQVSKYRNFKVNPLHRKYHLENLRNISSTCPGESEAIQANPDRVAAPLNTGGKLAVFELSRPGRQPDGVIPALVHGSKVMDFMWDPFDNSRLAVGTDDGKLWIWKIPEGGMKEQTNEPEFTIPAHGEKIYIVRFHPLAQDILATASYDLSIRIWDLSNQEGLFHIPCLDQVQILSLAWSPCGSSLATMAKDGKIRIYQPRSSVEPLVEGQGPSGVRSGRVCWALDGQYLIVSGFEKSSERQIQLYKVLDLSRKVAVPLDVSPSILVPFYDEDSSILFLYGRGDSTILAFDVTDSPPYLKQVNQNRLNGGHQGIAFLKKNAVDVQNVEFAKAYRLTEVAIEPLSFTVPRVKSEYFQDDLFPPTRVFWEPSMTADEWISGMNIEPRRISLKPDTMKAVGDIGVSFFVRDKSPSTSIVKSKKSTPAGDGDAGGYDATSNGEKKQQEQLEKAMREKLELNMTLEQDTMEGVDEEEWNE